MEDRGLMLVIYRREDPCIFEGKEGPYGKEPGGEDHRVLQRIKESGVSGTGGVHSNHVFPTESVKEARGDRWEVEGESMMTISVCLAGNWSQFLIYHEWRGHSKSGNSGRKETVQDLMRKVLDKRPAVGRGGVEVSNSLQFPGISTSPS